MWSLSEVEISIQWILLDLFFIIIFKEGRQVLKVKLN